MDSIRGFDADFFRLAPNLYKAVYTAYVTPRRLNKITGYGQTVQPSNGPTERWTDGYTLT